MTQQQGGQRVWRAAVIVLLASMVAGCGGDDEPDSATGSDRSASTASSAADQTTAPTTSTTGGTASEDAPDALTGAWVRIDGAACGSGYPLAIEFRDIDYLAELDPAVAPVIDSGGYELVEPTTIQMTRPNDAMVTLTLRLGDGELTLTDETGCVIDYRRA